MINLLVSKLPLVWLPTRVWLRGFAPIQPELLMRPVTDAGLARTLVFLVHPKDVGYGLRSELYAGQSFHTKLRERTWICARGLSLCRKRKVSPLQTTVHTYAHVVGNNALLAFKDSATQTLSQRHTHSFKLFSAARKDLIRVAQLLARLRQLPLEVMKREKKHGK